MPKMTKMTTCTTIKAAYHQVARLCHEQVNRTNLSVLGSNTIVNGIKPLSWHSQTNGRNCLRADIWIASDRPLKPHVIFRPAQQPICLLHSSSYRIVLTLLRSIPSLTDESKSQTEPLLESVSYVMMNAINSPYYCHHFRMFHLNCCCYSSKQCDSTHRTSGGNAPGRHHYYDISLSHEEF